MSDWVQADAGNAVSAVNALERERWNNPRYGDLWPKRERLTDAVTPTLLAALALRPGERALDIGCGGGRTTLAAAELVGPDGEVTGADISQPMLELARSRAAAAELKQVRFIEADVQLERVEGAPFGAALSQFGVMFFDDPVAAFTNIRAQLSPQGRLVFACWRGQQDNPWFPGLAVAGIAPAPPEPPPGRSATGPFTLADPARIREIASAAGFGSLTITPHDLVADVPDDAVLDDAQLIVLKIAPERMEEAKAAKARHLAHFRARPGRCRIPLAFQVVTAWNPSSSP